MAEDALVQFDLQHRNEAPAAVTADGTAGVGPNLVAHAGAHKLQGSDCGLVSVLTKARGEQTQAPLNSPVE